MIFEYAVEPAALSNFNALWQALEGFGVSSGRLISEYPKSWKRMVYEAASNCPAMHKKAIEVRLSLLGPKLVRSGRVYDPGKTWRDNAHEQQSKIPFRAIIQSDNVATQTCVLTELDLHAANQLWDVPTQAVVQRLPTPMASVIELLGKIGNELLFIDPYFAPEKRFVCVLLEFLRVAQVGNKKFCRIEIHTGISISKLHLEQEAKKWIAPWLPKSTSIRFYMWEEISGGEKLHARYVLTDKGGVGFDVGLDAGKPGETTDVRLLNQSLYNARWRDFQILTAAYKLNAYFDIESSCK